LENFKFLISVTAGSSRGLRVQTSGKVSGDARKSIWS